MSREANIIFAITVYPPPLLSRGHDVLPRGSEVPEAVGGSLNAGDHVFQTESRRHQRRQQSRLGTTR